MKILPAILFLLIQPILVQTLPSTVFGSGEEPRFTIGFYTGPVLPAGSERLTDYWGIGFIAGIHSGLFITEKIQLRSGLDYNQFSFRRDRFRKENNYPESQYQMTNNASSIVNLSVTALYYFPLNSRLNAYTGMSAGMMYLQIGDINVVENDQELTVVGTSKSGFEIGFSGGFEMHFWPATSLFSELGYWYGFTQRSNTRYMPLKLGVNVYL
jgi:hypothetical protein